MIYPYKSRKIIKKFLYYLSQTRLIYCFVTHIILVNAKVAVIEQMACLFSLVTEVALKIDIFTWNQLHMLGASEIKIIR